MILFKRCINWLLLLLSLLGSYNVIAAPVPPNVHLSFQERVLAAYALLAYKAPAIEQAQIQSRAVKYFASLTSQPVTTVNVANFNDFLKHFRGEWPDSGDLALDVQHIESLPLKGFAVYKSSSPRIQAQIDQYVAAHTHYLQTLSTGNYQDAGAQHPEQLKLEFEKIAESRLAEFNTIGTKIANSAFNEIPDPLDRIRLKILFDQYYSLLPLENKKYIISEILGQKMNLNEQEKFEIMVQNSGPQFQKFLQVVIRQNGVPESLKQKLKGLEDSAKSIPWWRVEQIVQSEKQNFEFTYFERNPLGIGTMAQVHRAKMLINGKRQDVVVRFIKPGIDHRIEVDHKILAQIAARIDNDPEYRRYNGPLMTPLMNDITQTVRAELDMKATIDRQTLAEKVYNKEVLLNMGGFKADLEFHAPKVYGADKKSQLMVQEMVIGRSLDKEAKFYAEIAPDLKRGIIEEVAKLWINEVFFGSGFFHSDLHQGNFLVNVEEPKIKVTLLDYGMGGQLDKKTQESLLLLSVALRTQKPEVIAEAYWNLSDQTRNQLSRQEFITKIEQRIKDLKKKYKTDNMFEWTGWASDHGLGLPYEFINLNRGILIITKSLEDAGSKLDFNSIAQSLAIKNPSKVYTALRSSKTLRWTDVMQLGWSNIQEPATPQKTLPKAAPVALTGLRCEQVFQ